MYFYRFNVRLNFYVLSFAKVWNADYLKPFFDLFDALFTSSAGVNNIDKSMRCEILMRTLIKPNIDKSMPENVCQSNKVMIKIIIDGNNSNKNNNFILTTILMEINNWVDCRCDKL